MNHHQFKSQQIHQIYKSKMHILVRVLLITLLSVFITLVFFDYDSSEVELNLSSKINCLDLGLTNENYICNTCFKISSKNKSNQQIIIQSQNPFLLVSLKEEISGILSCEEWLQAIDYEEVFQEDPYQRKTVRLQPTVNRFLASLQKEHNQILLVQRPNISNQRYLSNLKQYSSLQRPYQILSYFSRTRGSKPFRVYQTNDLIKSQSIHMLILQAIASNIAVFYSFHCTKSKNIVKMYKENVLSLLGIVGTLVWLLFTGLSESYDYYITFCKVVFFSLSLSVIYGAGRGVFFGIFTIVYTIITLQEISALYRSFMQIVLLFIVILKLCTQVKRQYYHLQKNSNKKIFFLIMTLLVVGSSLVSFIEDDSTLGQIFKFQQTFLIFISFLIGIKNLDGDAYHKILTQQKKTIEREKGQSFGSLGSGNDMYEDSQSLEESQMRQVKK